MSAFAVRTFSLLYVYSQPAFQFPEAPLQFMDPPGRLREPGRRDLGPELLAVRAGRLAGDHRARRHVLPHGGHGAHHGAAANVDVVLHARDAADHDPIVELATAADPDQRRDPA